MPGNSQSRPWGLMAPGRPPTPSEGFAQQYERVGPKDAQQLRTFDNGTCLQFGPYDLVDEFEGNHPFHNQVALIDHAINNLKATRVRYEGSNGGNPNSTGDEGLNSGSLDDGHDDFRNTELDPSKLSTVTIGGHRYVQAPSKHARLGNLVSVYLTTNKSDIVGTSHPGSADTRHGIQIKDPEIPTGPRRGVNRGRGNRRFREVNNRSQRPTANSRATRGGHRQPGAHRGHRHGPRTTRPDGQAERLNTESQNSSANADIDSAIESAGEHPQGKSQMNPQSQVFEQPGPTQHFADTTPQFPSGHPGMFSTPMGFLPFGYHGMPGMPHPSTIAFQYQTMPFPFHGFHPMPFPIGYPQPLPGMGMSAGPMPTAGPGLTAHNALGQPSSGHPPSLTSPSKPDELSPVGPGPKETRSQVQIFEERLRAVQQHLKPVTVGLESKQEKSNQQQANPDGKAKKNRRRPKIREPYFEGFLSKDHCLTFQSPRSSIGVMSANDYGALEEEVEERRRKVQKEVDEHRLKVMQDFEKRAFRLVSKQDLRHGKPRSMGPFVQQIPPMPFPAPMRIVGNMPQPLLGGTRQRWFESRHPMGPTYLGPPIKFGLDVKKILKDRDAWNSSSTDEEQEPHRDMTKTPSLTKKNQQRDAFVTPPEKIIGSKEFRRAHPSAKEYLVNLGFSDDDSTLFHGSDEGSHQLPRSGKLFKPGVSQASPLEWQRGYDVTKHRVNTREKQSAEFKPRPLPSFGNVYMAGVGEAGSSNWRNVHDAPNQRLYTLKQQEEDHLADFASFVDNVNSEGHERAEVFPNSGVLSAHQRLQQALGVANVKSYDEQQEDGPSSDLTGLLDHLNNESRRRGDKYLEGDLLTGEAQILMHLNQLDDQQPAKVLQEDDNDGPSSDLTGLLDHLNNESRRRGDKYLEGDLLTGEAQVLMLLDELEEEQPEGQKEFKELVDGSQFRVPIYHRAAPVYDASTGSFHTRKIFGASASAQVSPGGRQLDGITSSVSVPPRLLFALPESPRVSNAKDKEPARDAEAEDQSDGIDSMQPKSKKHVPAALRSLVTNTPQRRLGSNLTPELHQAADSSMLPSVARQTVFRTHSAANLTDTSVAGPSNTTVQKTPTENHLRIFGHSPGKLSKSREPSPAIPGRRLFER